MLNPTPFIQSTFNTVGAQIALIRKMHCYNNTFVQRNNSFESGVLEAILRLKCGASRGVLVGIFDETTPTVENILNRLGVLRGKSVGEGAIFFVLTAERYGCSVAEIDLILDSKGVEDGLFVSEESDYWSGAMARLMLRSIEGGKRGKRGKSITIINDLPESMRTALSVRTL